MLVWKGLALIFFTLLYGCEGNQNFFAGKGPQAYEIVKLWWTLFAIAVFVTLTVSFFLVKGAIKSDRTKVIDDQALGKGLVYGIAGTVSLLLLIIFSTLRLGHAPSHSQDSYEIKIVGKMWWWQVYYYDRKGKYLFETANEIVIPTNRSVRLKLLSDTVIHSFWVPALAGKVDMLPGRENYLVLKANEEGEFRGQCAEFCGTQHALMSFYVRAMPQDKYSKWKTNQMKSYKKIKKHSLGERVFVNSNCVKCHTIRGLGAASDKKLYGPDLTHLASRSHIAAATYPNNKGHLGGWILDPQGAKPGNYMPASALSGKDLNALLAFLGGLK